MAIGVRGIVVVKQSPSTLGMACAALHECRNVRVNDDVSKFARGVSTAKMRKESDPAYVAWVVARCGSDSYPILNYAWTNSQITSARLLNFLSEHPGRL